MRIGLHLFLGLILCLLALPLAQDPQYHTGLVKRQLASVPAEVAPPETTYHLLDDLTPAETSYLVQTTLVAAKGDIYFRINLFDYLLTWAAPLEQLAHSNQIPHFSHEWHRLLKSLAAKTSAKHILTGNSFLRAIGQSPFAEEIIIYFLQERLGQELQNRLLTLQLHQQPIWGDTDDLLPLSTTEMEGQDLTCSPRKRWPQLGAWIQHLRQLRPRPLGSRPYYQLSGGSFLIKKYLPWRLWQWPLGNDENRVAAAISELWSMQQIGQQDLCSAFSTQPGQLALRDLGLAPIQHYVPTDHPTALKRLQHYAAHPTKNLPVPYQIYCRKMLIPQIFQATPSLKDQKRHQLEFQIALRDLER